jgi:hypothetical protein
MSVQAVNRVEYFFKTSNVVMWAEEVASEAGVPIEVVPTKARSDASCGLAIRTSSDWKDRIEALFAAEGIAFQRGTD